jgi:hypothetical protein
VHCGELGVVLLVVRLLNRIVPGRNVLKAELCGNMKENRKRGERARQKEKWKEQKGLVVRFCVAGVQRLESALLDCLTSERDRGT